MEHMNLTYSEAIRFVSAYNKAVQDQATMFVFNGKDFLTKFAYYVIQFLSYNNKLKGDFDDNSIFHVTSKQESIL